jgi:hypothetical protein
MDLTSALNPAGSTHTRVFAAAPGRVVLAHDTCPAEGEPACGGGLGNHLVLGHDGGYATLYAHLDSLRVRQGDRVARGDVVGIMGSSGNASGVHLHFDLLSFTPVRTEEIGPRYTDSYPEENGHLDPKDFVRHSIVEISGETAPVLERPESYSIPTPDIITTAAEGQRFVSLAESGNWHYLYLPSNAGPAAPTWSPGAIYGWVQGGRVPDDDGTVICTVANHDFIPVRSGRNAALPELTRLWSGQRYAVRKEAGSPALSCGGDRWYRIDLPANAGAREGWVYGEKPGPAERSAPASR